MWREYILCKYQGITMWHLLIITQHWVRKDTRKYQTSSATLKLKVKLIEMLWYNVPVQFSANLPRKISTNSTASSTSDVSCRSNPDVPSYSSNTNMSSQISSMFYGVVIHNKWWNGESLNVCTIFTNDLYPNNSAFECLTSLVNTFPWISSVCWDKWLIFLFSLLCLVYLKHARIVDICVRCFHMFTNCVGHT